MLPINNSSPEPQPNATAATRPSYYGVSQFIGRVTRRESKGSDSSNSSSVPNPKTNSFQHWSNNRNPAHTMSSIPSTVSATKMARKFSQTVGFAENTTNTTTPLHTFDFHSCCQRCTPKATNQSWTQYLICKCCNCCGSSHTNTTNILLGSDTKIDNTTRSFLLYVAHRCIIPWNIIKFVCSLILLFLSNIQNAWCPPTVDEAFNVLYIMAFVFLMLDIIRLSFFDSSYLPLQLWKWKNNSAKEEPDKFSTRKEGPFLRLGSFLFWCDLLSTCTLIYDISYFSSRLSAMQFIHLHTDLNGSVINTTLLQRAKLVQLPLIVFVAVARTARIARFLAPSSVQKISSKVNWLSIPQCFRKSYQSCCVFEKSREKNLNNSLRKENQGTICCNFCRLPLVSRKRFDDDHTVRRNAAASMIQNAWRRFKEGPSEFGSEKNIEDSYSSARAVSTKASKRPSILLRALSSRRSFVSNDSATSSSKSKSNTSSLAHETQVGTAMRDLTGQRVAFGILIAVIATVLFTYLEVDTTKPATALYVHNLSRRNFDLGKFVLNSTYADERLISFFFCNETSSSENEFFTKIQNYQNCNATNAVNFINPSMIRSTGSMGSMKGVNRSRIFLDHSSDTSIRYSEKLNITICTLVNNSCIASSQSYFDITKGQNAVSSISLTFTVFVLILWFFSVTSFVGPLMVLVVIPIERMIRLLRMMMRDPLGYQSSKRYKAFTLEENDFTKNTFWRKEVLKGMETNFLMSTIQRIGSLMRVGFGTAGVEIIRNSLERGGNNKDVIFKNLQGSLTSSIFMFCDIRGFTDATECLQEEIFAFTNRIAAVVHSYCHTYGGAANQNAGDAFLITWKLDAPDFSPSRGMSTNSGMLRRFSTNIGQGPNQSFLKSSLYSSKQQAQADKALLACVKICMALQYDDFFLDTLSQSARKKLRDKVSSKRSGPVVQMGIGLHAGKAVQGAIGSQMKLDPTFVGTNVNFAEFLESSSKDYGVNIVMSHLFVQMLKPTLRVKCRKIDRICFEDEDIDDIIADLPDSEEKDVIELYTLDFDISSAMQQKAPVGYRRDETPTLLLPNGPSIYRDSIWRTQEYRNLFKRFDSDFFQRYNDGLNSYYARDWTHAQACFESLFIDFDDGPSKYFLNLIREQGRPPKNFASHRVVSY